MLFFWDCNRASLCLHTHILNNDAFHTVHLRIWHPLTIKVQAQIPWEFKDTTAFFSRGNNCLLLFTIIPLLQFAFKLMFVFHLFPKVNLQQESLFFASINSSLTFTTCLFLTFSILSHTQHNCKRVSSDFWGILLGYLRHFFPKIGRNPSAFSILLGSSDLSNYSIGMLITVIRSTEYQRDSSYHHLFYCYSTICF